MTFLMRRNRGQGVRTLRDEMDRLFDDFFSAVPDRNDNNGIWSPNVDIREDENNFTIVAELPGMAKEDIDLEVEQNTLAIKGERKFERKDEGENYHFVERSYGSFYRSFRLPKNVDGEAISAEYKDGLLTVILPKQAEVKPKKVEIKM
ncbi:Hsp20/alpha crystallin family protein [bacterium]|nr:Hsp20/alpha crystallin family protein [bacterium]